MLAIRFLEKVYLPNYNKMFTVDPLNSFDAHRPLEGLNLRAIVSIHAERVVANDYMIWMFGKKFQIDHGSVVAGLNRSKVLFERRLNSEITAKYKSKYLYINGIFHK
jgi:hypothetical protein